ncbi:zinc finger protein 311 isoform X1 [Drosophila pseudoobscura]|uniref:Zinc finger protein 311 isoform X1 n=2 Tax=Drosophila pseudoobscura pseudoobscura TaxID=46245 RepID=A0A6I8VII9_DROPS|nr:zinc finger protein 311 isoform X1 [Drosophila pseudoobscura]
MFKVQINNIYRGRAANIMGQPTIIPSTQLVSIAAAEQEMTALAVLARQREDEQANYSVCLEDAQLFGQLDELRGDEDTEDMELMMLSPGADFDLIDLVNGALDPTGNHHHSNTRLQSKPKRTAKQGGPQGAPHACDVCGRRFSEAYNLRIHKMTHTDEKPHVCDGCGKGFRQLNKLRIHYVTHTPDRPHKCDICGKGFRFANYLVVHRRLHTGEKPYSCSVEECDLTFHSIHARRIHTKLQHAAPVQSDAEQEQPETTTATSSSTSSLCYTCTICGRVLTDQCYLNTHMKRHYNQRDFPCPQPECGKRFFSSSELKHHQIAHTQYRPYACTECPARFLRKSNYKQHLKIHER